MTTRVVLAFLIGTCVTAMFGAPAFADSLDIHPTIFKGITLKVGERKKAYVDVVNPTGTSQVVAMKAQAFRQTDDSGALAFYDDERIAKGVKLDLTDFELGPREAIRVYFLLDGTVLPSGDVFAAIFARTTPAPGAAVQSIQVGSLLTIVNGTPSSHTADVSALSAPFVQVGEAVTADFSLKNPADEKTATGFFPTVNVRAWPYDSRTVEGPLLFAGRTRSIQYSQPGDYFGIINLQVDAGGKPASRLMLVATGYWRWLAPLLALVSAAVIAALLVWRRRRIVSSRIRKRY